LAVSAVAAAAATAAGHSTALVAAVGLLGKAWVIFAGVALEFGIQYLVVAIHDGSQLRHTTEIDGQKYIAGLQLPTPTPTPTPTPPLPVDDVHIPFQCIEGPMLAIVKARHCALQSMMLVDPMIHEARR
jgi:hypothetical protein